MMKRCTALLILLCLLLPGFAAADSMVNTPYSYTADNTLYEGLYTGACENGLPEGFGLFIAKDGDTVFWHYIGLWHEGFPEGEGAVYYENGQVQRGVFAKGVLQSTALTAAMPNTDGDVMYIGNVKTRAFHLPSCSSVTDMKPENRAPLYSRDEAVSQGYHPCGRCKP